MVLGTALTDNVRQLCTHITDLNQKIRDFVREFNLRRDSHNFIALQNILSQNMWYWHRLQLMLQSSEHHKDVRQITWMIQQVSDRFITAFPTRAKGLQRREEGDEEGVMMSVDMENDFNRNQQGDGLFGSIIIPTPPITKIGEPTLTGKHG